jgi:dephospho-CoA kinase
MAVCGNMRKMFILGLTGPSGAGKSLAARHLETRGFSCVDADMVSRVVAGPGSPCLKALAAAFGAGIVRGDGSLDRKKLAELAFAGGRVGQLNAVTHPFIVREIESRLAALENAGVRFTVLDAPTLFESGADKFCCRVMAVTASRALRIERVMARDCISREQAQTHIDAQPKEVYYKEKADFTVCSDGGKAELFAAVDRVADIIRGKCGGCDDCDSRDKCDSRDDCDGGGMTNNES